MQEAFVTKGHWWLPETPEKEIPGELQYSPEDGVKLELQGDLRAQNGENFHPPDFQDAPLILGITMKGEAVSLVDCTQIKGKVNIEAYVGVPETGFRVKHAFTGIHFPDPDSVKFRKISVRFTHLDDWLDQKPFYVEYPSNTTGGLVFTEVTLYYKRPDALIANVGEYAISFVAAGPSIRQPTTNEFVISQKAWVIIKSVANENNLQEFLGMMRRIQDFLTIGVGEPVYPIEMEGFCEVNKQILNKDKEYFPPVKIVYDRPWQIKPAKQKPSFFMIFTLKTLQDRLELCLNNWFSKADSLKPVLDIYFSILYQEQIYSEFRFLGLIQAIETYHRRIYGGKYLPDKVFLNELYPNLVAAIPSNLDPGFKQSLKKGKLRYANEFSLRKRLLVLTRRLGKYLPFRYLSEKKERQIFIERVTNTRNYLTHYDLELAEKAARTGAELFELFKRLRAMLDGLLLEDIGFEPEQIREMMKKNKLYEELFDE